MDCQSLSWACLPTGIRQTGDIQITITGHAKSLLRSNYYSSHEDRQQCLVNQGMPVVIMHVMLIGAYMITALIDQLSNRILIGIL